jgi:S1-C subfamily serine protease
MKNLLLVSFLFLNLFTAISQTNDANFIITDDGKCKIYDPNFVKGNTYTWNGSSSNNLASGRGTCMVYIKDSLIETIEANFENGVAQGIGKIKKDSQVITGSFVDGMIMGNGTIKNEEGYEYSGNLVNGIAHGFGNITYNTGSTFEGLVKDNVFWTGKYMNLRDEVSYYLRQETVEDLAKNKDYNPELNKQITEYFDENYNPCDKAVATYFRKITYEAPNKPKGIIRDFFINGSLMGEFECWYINYYDDDLKFFKAGTVKYYYSDGVPYSIIEFNQRNSIRGESKKYHGNGMLKETANYNEFGYLDGDKYVYDEYGNLTTAYYYDNGYLKDDSYFIIDENGLWTGYYPTNFEKDKDNWEEYSELSYAYVMNNRLNIINEKGGVYSKSKFIGFDHTVPHRLFCSAYIDKAEDFSIIFDYLDNSNYAFFTITPKAIEIKRVINGETTNVFFEKMKMIKGYNELLIDNFEGFLTFYINNKLVFECRSWDYTGYYAAIYVEGKASLLIDQFETFLFYSPEESQGFSNFVAAGGTKAEENRDIMWDASGSGFFISNSGYVATNYHVIQDATTIEIEYNQNGEKKTYEATVTLSDKINDLAILEISDTSFTEFKKLPYELIYTVQDVGADVFTLGYPLADVLGEEIKYTNGAISSKTGIDGDITVYQISVPIQPGNSGGPLFNTQGNIVGITSARLNKEMFESENVNYAIKLSYLKNLIDVLPKQIETNTLNTIKDLPTTEKIKALQDFIPIIHVKY